MLLLTDAYTIIIIATVATLRITTAPLLLLVLQYKEVRVDVWGSTGKVLLQSVCSTHSRTFHYVSTCTLGNLLFGHLVCYKVASICFT